MLVSDPIEKIDLGAPTVLEFKGPDAVRFLNGQTTQDIRLLAGEKISLPSCVTDAKGRLQFRVHLTAVAADAVWVTGPAEWREALAARLTRYLIADEVELSDLTGMFRLIHLTGQLASVPAGVIARLSHRYGVAGMDWWLPTALEIENFPNLLDPEAFRISHGIPAWGSELTAGMLPPEARLEATDISYQKGCYIGQEVISRVKSAGKVNRYLTKFALPPEPIFSIGNLLDSTGKVSGELTSISSQITDGSRPALGYIKRDSIEYFLPDKNGISHALRTV